jgi:RNA polymerase sigma-70 factor (ECF subfamily)
MNSLTDLPSKLACSVDAHVEELVTTYQDRLYAFARRFTTSAGDAEEVVQDAFVRAYHALQRYTPEQRATLALRPWLFTITLNLARNHARRRSVPVRPLLDLDADTLASDPASQPEQQAMAASSARELASLVGTLPLRYRVGVVLRHVHGLPYAEIAAITGQPTGTIKANVHRGVALLRQALAIAERQSA